MFLKGTDKKLSKPKEQSQYHYYMKLQFLLEASGSHYEVRVSKRCVMAVYVLSKYVSSFHIPEPLGWLAEVTYKVQTVVSF